MKKTTWNRIFVGAAIILGFAGSNYVYNHVHAWGGIILAIGVALIAVNYIVKQIKKSN